MNQIQRQARGEALLEQMLGAEAAREIRHHWQAICPEFENYVVEFLAGEIWSREGLDLRTRSLVTVGILAALGRTRGLELNLRMALRNGATRRELVETLLQTAPYAGFPAAWEGLALLDEVLRESPEAPPA